MSFTQIPNMIIDRAILNPYQFQIFSIIVRKTDGWCKVEDGISLSQFEKMVSFSKNKIISTLKELEDLNLIEKRTTYNEETKQYSYSMYKVNNLVVHEVNKGSAPREQGVVHEVNKQKKANTKETNTSINPLPLCINPTVWAEWVQHRKEIKKPLTPSTIQKQIAQLEKFDKLGMDTTEIINASISAGYVGLFALRTGKKYQPQQELSPSGQEKHTPGEWARILKQEQLDKQNINDAEVLV